MEQAVGDAMVEVDWEENRQRIKQLLDAAKGKPDSAQTGSGHQRIP